MRIPRNTTSNAPRGARFAVVVAAVAALVSGLLVAPAAAAEPAKGTVAEASVGAAASGVGDIAKAADLAKFNPGHIISDAVFFNKGTMSEAQIQAFLDSKVRSCQSGYVCLKDKYDTPRTVAADAMCGAYSGGVRERASRIIYKVAQACGINPQVLLVLLEKEQSLVSHTWPSEWRYTKAMGQGCPDTAGCDVRYEGFFNQVFGSAWQFKRYANPPGTSQFFTWYAPGKTWNIQFNPNAGCGSAPVHVQNQATSNLYYYTPYQPNAAALRAGYGSGDSCSAYGNRNFYNFFNDWFGSTAAAAPAPTPTISSVDRSSFVLALDSGGVVWGYPLRDGVWGTRVELARGLTTAKGIFSVGDLDGDGRRDLVTTDAAGGVYVRPGLSGAGYGEARQLPVNWSGVTRVAAAGDFDGDGMPDMFTVNGAGALQLWRGTAYGHLVGPTAIGTGWQAMDTLIGATDHNGDKIPDLIARDTQGRLWLYPGAGGGRFGSRAQIGNGWQSMTAILSPGDVTGDGRPDLVARDASGSMITYRGDGRGGLSAGPRSGSGWQAMRTLTGTGPEVTAARQLPAARRDFDGDRQPDVLALDGSGRLLAYRGTGAGGWLGSIVLAQGWAPSDRVVSLGDFDGDGLSDAGRITGNGALLLYSGAPNGKLKEGRQIGSGWAGFRQVLGGYDFDGDRRPDVLAQNAAGDLLLYRGDGSGGWLGSTRVGNGWGVFDALFSTGDFDGDGNADVLARQTDGILRLYPGNGGGGWNAPRTVGNGWQVMTALAGPGNFDGQGGADVLARNVNGNLVLYRGDGKGGWLGSGVVGNGWNGFTQIR